ncbi:MAG: hypothetical protein HDS53_04180 [Barnesiella sp.]|nr:hypothetical protein [Barnesiella sp.]
MNNTPEWATQACSTAGGAKLFRPLSFIRGGRSLPWRVAGRGILAEDQLFVRIGRARPIDPTNA